MKIDGVEIHKDLTEETVFAAARREMFELDNPGFCVMCGVEAEGVEPDARNYRCDSCGANCVYGAEHLLLHMVA